MAIQYAFLDRGPESLIEVSELPVVEGIAVAIRSTGYEIGTDEVLELAITDLAGTELFCQRVKPQNIESWNDDRASGGITPESVAESPELYQFEDEIIALFENAPIVVAEHSGFAKEMIESSWVSLPAFKGFDLVEQFRASHATAEHPDQAAPAASLESIAQYYEIAFSGESTADLARTIASCYRCIVDEHARERANKGPDYWAAYEREQEEALRNDRQQQERNRIQTVKSLRVNAIMWLCAAAIFSNLAVQLSIRGFDVTFVIMSAAVAVFAAVRWIIALYRIFQLRR